MNNILVYVGLGTGAGLPGLTSKYNRVIGFEPNPYQFSIIQDKCKQRNMDNVQLYNYAVSDTPGEVDFFVSENDVCSSLNTFGDIDHPGLKLKDKIKVQAVHLLDFLKSVNVPAVDTYISDIQGHDLRVLKTLEPLLLSRTIKEMKIETWNNNTQTYKDCTNSINDYLEYEPLCTNYNIAGIEEDGALKDNLTDTIRTIMHKDEFDTIWITK